MAPPLKDATLSRKHHLESQPFNIKAFGQHSSFGLSHPGALLPPHLYGERSEKMGNPRLVSYAEERHTRKVTQLPSPACGKGEVGEWRQKSG